MQTMDEFGVLVESYGFKPYGKSAPMAKSKPKPNSQFTPNTSSSSFADSSSLPVDKLDGIFRSNVNINQTTQPENLLGDYGGIDLESVLNSSVKNNDQKNGGNLNSVGSNGCGDLLGLHSEQSGPVVDDSFGSFGMSSSGKQETKDPVLEDLVSGLGSASPSNKGVHLETNPSAGLNVNSSKSNPTMEDEPLLIFETSVTQSGASRPFAGPPEQDAGKDSVQVSLDELDNFAMGHKDSKNDRSRNKTDDPSSSTSNGFKNVDDLDAFFGGVQQKHAAKPTSTREDPQFDVFFGKEKGHQVKKSSSWSSSNSKNASSATSAGDDFTALFGDVATSSGEFHEIEGEPEERRRARLNVHMRINARVAEALAEKNQRDLQSQYEQEEKHRLAETLEYDIKRWAAGKEGNLRALLSSLQQVLWAECGWRPVSLTDMITSDSVKKVYKKAYLYVHPDKVQQKGANLQQKYIAEKVFYLLKEAWNKFSAEELR